MFRKSDNVISICITIFMIVLYSLNLDIKKWEANPAYREMINDLCLFLKEHTIINVFVTCACMAIFSWKVCGIWKDNNFRLYRPMLILLGFEMVYLENNLKSITIIFGVTYGFLLNTLLFGVGIVVIYKAYIAFLSNRNIMLQARGFSTDDIDINNVSKNLKEYANSIVTHLLNTETSVHSFALGVTGEWGGGKTTFLELLDSKMKGRAEVVWFNPWMCRSPEQVADDFFVSLHKKLSPKYSSLSRPIRDYAQYINNATISIGGGLLSKLTFALPRESLKTKKDRLSDRLSKLKLPVVVFIDDLDRLEMDEVFEVLRLIRNTADLKNVLYVVAYDKDYVTNVLLEKKIENPAAYLEKIFPVEVHQPKVEDVKLRNVLYEELSRKNKNGERFAKKLLSLFKQTEMRLILDILDNYRRVKRFARRYVLIVDYLIEAGIKEIKLIDLFWIELLQGYDKFTYDLLMHEPLTLLYVKGERYKLRPNILNENYIAEDEKRYEYKGKNIWMPKTPELLGCLFNRTNNDTRLSIAYKENYEKYFLLGVSELKLSVSEFNRLFEKRSNPAEIINNWAGKYYDSVLFQFISKDANTLDSDGLWRYMTGMMHLAYSSAKNGGGIEYKVKHMLYEKNYYKEKKDEARGYLLAWFYEIIDDNNTDFVALSKFMKCLYQPVSYDVDSDEKHEPVRLILSNNDVTSLLISLMTKYLSNHNDLTAIDILKEKSYLGKIFKNCCVCEIVSSIYDFEEFENVAFPVVVKWFAGKNVKPSANDYTRAMDSMFYEDDILFDGDSDYNEYMADRYDYQQNAYFGSNDYWFDQFKSRCFDVN